MKEKEKEFSCSYCHKIWEKISVLNRHISETHLKIKKFICKLCDK